MQCAQQSTISTRCKTSSTDSKDGGTAGLVAAGMVPGGISAAIMRAKAVAGAAAMDGMDGHGTAKYRANFVSDVANEILCLLSA